jgi:hypothetical protein
MCIGNIWGAFSFGSAWCLGITCWRKLQSFGSRNVEVGHVIRYVLHRCCDYFNVFVSNRFLLYLRILLRLYGCLRLACGWILWHVRAVDDGRFRKHICEALFFCYTFQVLSVLRAQSTDRASFINWIAIAIFGMLAAAYGSHRFRKGGNLIKIYELPSGVADV